MTERFAELMFFNGINGVTGAYWLDPISAEDFSKVEELEDFAPPDLAAPGAQPYTLKPDGRIYPYQAVQFLLAIDTGLPDLARKLFDALDDPAWLAFTNLKGQLQYLQDPMDLSTGNTANDEYNDQRELLRDWWKENDPELAETIWYGAPDLNMLRKWSGYVSRFSFQVYSPIGPLEAA